MSYRMEGNDPLGFNKAIKGLAFMAVGFVVQSAALAIYLLYNYGPVVWDYLKALLHEVTAP